MTETNETNQETISKALILGILSSTATLITAIIGSSTTQIVDFFRRFIEMFSTLISLLLFRHNLHETSAEKIHSNNQKVNLVINNTLILSGILMIIVGIAKYRMGLGHKNVVPGFFVSLLGVILNFYFCIKYSRSLKRQYEPIIKSQYNLFKTKTIVDSCVLLTVGIMIIFPDFAYLDLIDFISSVLVSIVLCFRGIRHLIKKS